MSSQTMSGKTNYNTDPNHIYYNLQLFNNDTVGTSNSVPVRFQETRTSTILANPSEYFLSIQRFHIDTPSLPVFMPEVETDPVANPTADPNQLIYKIAIYRQNGTTRPLVIPIKFDPSFNPYKLPPSTLDVNALSNPYYFVYEFQNFIDMINRSIYDAMLASTVYQGFRSVIPTFTISKGNIFQIYFPSESAQTIFDAQGNVTTAGSYRPLWNSVPNDGFTPPYNNSQNFLMAFNSPLHSLFSSFSYRYIDSLNNMTNANFTPLFTGVRQTHGWYELVVKPPNTDGLNLPPLPISVFNTNFTGLDMTSVENTPFSNINAWPYSINGFNPRSWQIITQPYSSAPLWSCVKQLIFTTALMPVNNELVGLPGVVNSNTALDTDVQNNNFSPVITDLEVPLITGDEIKPSISYSPNGEYRLIDLMSNTPINSIEISVYWKDQYGVLHPFVLEPGCFSSLKILFRRKIFNLIYLPEYTKSIN
jgi:hypothetical protein